VRYTRQLIEFLGHCLLIALLVISDVRTAVTGHELFQLCLLIALRDCISRNLLLKLLLQLCFLFLSVKQVRFPDLLLSRNSELLVLPLDPLLILDLLQIGAVTVDRFVHGAGHRHARVVPCQLGAKRWVFKLLFEACKFLVVVRDHSDLVIGHLIEHRLPGRTLLVILDYLTLLKVFVKILRM
jgi:hypothetical protein